MSDSPARNEATSASRPVCAVTTPAREVTTGRRILCLPPHNARVNQIGAASPNSTGTSGSGSGGGSGGSTDRTDSEEYYDYNQGIPNNDAPEPFTNYDEACINLLQIDVPD